MVCKYPLHSMHIWLTVATGQLPFLVHDEQVVVSFPSIIKYVVGLGNSDPLAYPNANLDGSLGQLEKAQKQAWCAHVNSDLGDLVVRQPLPLVPASFRLERI
jgi:hypothetical protein